MKILLHKCIIEIYEHKTLRIVKTKVFKGYKYNVCFKLKKKDSNFIIKCISCLTRQLFTKQWRQVVFLLDGAVDHIVK